MAAQQRTPRKATAPKRATTPSVEHTDSCSGPRMESYDATRPDSTAVRVTRCMECGAQTVK